MSSTAQDPAAIERDLQATRSRLGLEISELASRLSPGEILNEALGCPKTQQGADFSRNLAQSIRERPIPVALMRVGLAYLMASPSEHRPAYGSASRWSREDDLMTRAWNAGR